jgi:hypothetical protein
MCLRHNKFVLLFAVYICIYVFVCVCVCVCVCVWINSQSVQLAARAHIFYRSDNKLYRNRLFLALVILIYLEILGCYSKPPPFRSKNKAAAPIVER